MEKETGLPDTLSTTVPEKSKFCADAGNRETIVANAVIIVFLIRRLY